MMAKDGNKKKQKYELSPFVEPRQRSRRKWISLFDKRSPATSSWIRRRDKYMTWLSDALRWPWTLEGAKRMFFFFFFVCVCFATMASICCLPNYVVGFIKPPHLVYRDLLNARNANLAMLFSEMSMRPR